MVRSRTTRAALGALLLTTTGACVTRTVPAQSVGTSKVPEGPVAQFKFDSLDDRPVSSEAFLGRPTVLVFLSVSSIKGQAEANYLLAMAKNDGDKIAYALVCIDSAESRELAEIYRAQLHLPFPFAMLDAETRDGAGFFGDVNHEPIVVVLDRHMHQVFRAEGHIVKSEEIRDALRGL